MAVCIFAGEMMTGPVCLHALVGDDIFVFLRGAEVAERFVIGVRRQVEREDVTAVTHVARQVHRGEAVAGLPNSKIQRVPEPVARRARYGTSVMRVLSQIYGYIEIAVQQKLSRRVW